MHNEFSFSHFHNIYTNSQERERERGIERKETERERKKKESIRFVMNQLQTSILSISSSCLKQKQNKKIC